MKIKSYNDFLNENQENNLARKFQKMKDLAHKLYADVKDKDDVYYLFGLTGFTINDGKKVIEEKIPTVKILFAGKDKSATSEGDGIVTGYIAQIPNSNEKKIMEIFNYDLYARNMTSIDEEQLTLFLYSYM